MASKSSQLVLIAIVNLVLCVSARFQQFNHLKDEEPSIGLISPIEVIEEWACPDSHIRLTCSQLDSKIAVLEATFEPNCTKENKSNCEIFDSGGRITRAFLHSRADFRLKETETGRRFLETLRRSHGEYLKQLEEREEPVDQSEFYGNDGHEVHDKNQKLQRHRQEEDTVMLKVTLEKMIVEYLKKLSPEEDFDSEAVRKRRNLINAALNISDFESAQHEMNFTELWDEEEDAVGVNGGGDNVESLSENSDKSDIDLDGNSSKSGGNKQKVKHLRKQCPVLKRNISSLSRLDMDKATENETDQEYNIRRIINHRCSGKNHCNFIFSQDHAFGLIWNSGIVRIKYACMNDFRITKYCGEYLVIGNEIRPSESSARPLERTAKIKEPVAQAQVQMNAQLYHQFTNLKILKPDEVDEEKKVLEQQRRLKEEQRRQKTKEKWENPNKVYSQDFRLLKILPANLDDFNDIEKIGDEFYFRKEEEKEEKNENDLSKGSDEFSENSISQLPVEPPTKETMPDLSMETTIRRLDELINDTNLNAWEEENEVLFTRNSSVDNRLDLLTSTNASTNWPVDDDNAATTEKVDLGQRNFSLGQDKVSKGGEDGEEDEVDEVEEALKKLNYLEKSVITGGDSLREKLLLGSEDEHEDYGENDDDYYDEYEYVTGYRNSGPRKYKSIQRTALRNALLQGFIMSPGYPSYYIGETDCKWIVTVPRGKRIRITLVDVALRYDQPCRDYLEIVDLGDKRKLYSSCSELLRPIVIVSQSNVLRISLKTTTKVAYPKRGVLLHYMALGCLTPNLPPRVELLSRTEDLLTVFCAEDSLVFPDSGKSYRELKCNDKHIWNNFIPDCIEIEQVSGSGLVSHLSSGQSGGGGSGGDMNKSADMVVDVIIPSIIIGALFLVNIIIMVIIMRHRNKRKQRYENDLKELAEL